MREPQAKYHNRIRVYDALLTRQLRWINRISNLRLLVFLAGIALWIWLYVMQWYYILAAAIIAVAGGFVLLVVYHEKLTDQKLRTSALKEINQASLQRIEGKWTEFPDSGKEFGEENHPFSQDLDLFGQGSLFQWTSTAKTYWGRVLLSRLMAEPPKDAGRIAERQKAVCELASQLKWRQRFLAEAMRIPGNSQDPRPLIQWAAERNPFYGDSRVKWLFRLLPVLTVASFILVFITPVVPLYLPMASLLAQIILLGWGAGRRKMIFAVAEKYKNDIKVYYRLLEAIETKKFVSSCLGDIKDRMHSPKQQTTCKQIERLSKIIDAISNRNNLLFAVVNILTLWDYQCMIALENWKQTSGQNLEDWFMAIGEIEVLSSLALVRHDHMDWTMPKLVQEGTVFEAVQMAHPLLSASRVANDVSFPGSAHVLLITGSNMSGKSTLLRTAGINLVLAYSGAPVCASSFTASILNIYSSMRVSDNLEKSISSFYAELLRIKKLTDAVRNGERIFFLLDEIFKGTNSIDRHTGARVLVTNLCGANTIGLVSTHDLELCSMEKENPTVRNFHFREYYRDNRIHFDYKLRKGASTTRNAAYLMKMAGIDVGEGEK